MVRGSEWTRAKAFVVEFERAILRVRRAPLRGPSYQHGTRKTHLRRFPFALVYRVGLDEIQVLAVAHLHRRPGYWRDRESG